MISAPKFPDIPKSWYISSLLIFLMTLWSYFYLDKAIFGIFYPYRGAALFYPIELLTTLGDSLWYIILSIAFYLLLKKCDPSRARAGLFLLSTILLSGIIANIIKVIFGRARPQIFADDHLYGFFWFKLDVLYRSFPSGHAATAMGVWLAFALFFPRYRWSFIGLGVAICLSRVALAQHYLSDVLIGGWIGAMTTLLLFSVFYPKDTHANSI